MSAAVSETNPKRVWYALDVQIESPAREAVEYALMEAGALGTETHEGDELSVTAYFAEIPNREIVRTQVADALRIYDLPTSSVRDMTLREVADQDWLRDWKKSWQPVEVGSRFIVAPPWSEIADSRGRIVIRIEPGMAFGTGTHETTRLVLAFLEKHFEGGSFLDVGTGTGILAIAAAKLFPEAHIEACDTDTQAVAISCANAELNDVSNIIFRTGTVDVTTASADCVCANLNAEVIVELLPALLGATCGRLVLSGILDSQVGTVVARLQELGVGEPLEIVSDGEWVAMVV